MRWLSVRRNHCPGIRHLFCQPGDRAGWNPKRLDCRPSDAIALVVRTGVPIFVDEDVLERAPVTPEEEVHPEDIESEHPGSLLENLRYLKIFFSKLDHEDSDEQDAKSADDDPDLAP